MLLCYEQDFLRWTCVALLCFVSQNRRALQDMEESCTGQGEPVLRQWPGPATPWAEAWERSRVKPESEVRLGLESGRNDSRHSWSCNITKVMPLSQPEESWLKAALELNTGDLALNLILSSYSSGLNLLNSWEGGRCTPCFGLAKTCLFPHVKTWCISIKSETGFTRGFLEDYVKSIPYAKIIPLHQKTQLQKELLGAPWTALLTYTDFEM